MKPIENISVLKPEANWYAGKGVEKCLLVFADVFALLLAFYFSINVTKHPLSEPTAENYFSFSLVNGSFGIFTILAIAVTAFWFKGLYSVRRLFWNEAREIFFTVSTLPLAAAILFLLTRWPISPDCLLLFWFAAPSLVILARTTIKRFLMRIGGWTRSMVIVGWGENLVETARAFADEPLMGYRIVAFLIPEGKSKPLFNDIAPEYKEIPCLRLNRKPQTFLEQLGNPHIVLAMEQGGIDEYQDMVQCLSRSSHSLQIVPSLRGLPLYGMEVSHFFSHEVLLLSVRNNLARHGPQLLKRAFDIFVSLSLLVIGSPIFLWLALKVAATGRPIFYGHRRVGRNGKDFMCYKFRTMQPNAAQLLQELLERDPEARAEWAKDFKLKNDPRITPIGHFLRKTSLDELPQLWNVLKGEMSLVGPRPIVDAELERYGAQVDHYLNARPGITGLWQISGRNDITYDTRVYLDSWYVKNWSFFYDAVILIKTIKVILKKDGAY